MLQQKSQIRIKSIILTVLMSMMILLFLTSKSFANSNDLFSGYDDGTVTRILLIIKDAGKELLKALEKIIIFIIESDFLYKLADLIKDILRSIVGFVKNI